MRPMLATAAEAPPRGDAWVHEVKWDGMRVLVDVRSGSVTVTSRTERDVTAAFPELDALAGTYDDLLLDGEVVALDEGLPSFHALTERMHVTKRAQAERLARSRPVTLMVFDLLRLFGQDLTGQPWSARRRLLEELELDGRAWRVPEVHDDGAVLLRVTGEQGLEGVVSKRRDARYLPGRRSPDWRKVAHRRTYSVVIGGWRPEVGSGASSADRLGAVLVGLPDGEGGWRYAGRVGSGLAGSAGEALLRRVRRHECDAPPFADEVPRIDASGTTWVEPAVVVEVRTLQLTPDHRLRQPTFLGVRADLTPDELQEVEEGG
ncbi:non-homologous end-joining DNA ligase [Phycicoccus sp. MAQZ13P-2]|uniref:non-homologous end-joining DNA ligase n=1 Tax=Phycicoccus mangrovi TaxID=2840470 RepID=UPI001C004299|nr:non-homologous end-joining DNA ligase [Phycicoccus mangrovi]MBT9256819.1 non-homologous end-joining DNA ligase [Phycicoccus mangrovi]MBT9275032.1 non-homologous end-joining DNA ligase [Phycicoccus mangrovi]